MRITDKYVFFYGGEFSQWHKCAFTYKGLTYNCAEQAMMHQKALLFGDVSVARMIMSATSPKEQKALGREVQNFDQTKWSKESDKIVTEINYCKFSQNPALKKLMLSVGEKTFVEASPRDRIWGIGMGENSYGVEDPYNWNGKNKLGQCLTEVSNKIRGESV